MVGFAGRALLALAPLLGLTSAQETRAALDAWAAEDTPELQSALLAGELDTVELRELFELAAPAAPLDQRPAWFVFTALQQLSAQLDDDPTTAAERVELLERGRTAVAPVDAGYAAGLAVEQARLLNSLGRDGRAREVCLEALEALPEGDSWRAWVLRQLGEQARFRRDVTAARDWLEAAREACEPGRHRGHTRLEAMILVSHASLLLDVGLTDLAAPVLDAAGEALERAKQAATAGEKPPVYTELEYECARVGHEAALGRRAAAIARGRAVMERFASQKRPGLETLCEKIRCRVGIAELHSGELPAAEASLERVLRSPHAESWDLASAGMWLAYLRLKAGEADRAADLVAGTRARIDTLAAQKGSRVPGRELGVVAALELRLALGSDDVAAVHDRLAAVEAAFRRMVAEWREAPHRAGGVGFLRYEAARLVVEALIDGVSRTAEPRAACERALGFLHHAQTAGTLVRDLSGGQAPPPFDPDALPVGTGLLVYFRGAERVHAFALYGGTARHVECPNDAARWSEFTWLVATPPAAGGPGRSQRLAELGAELRAGLVPDVLLEVVAPAEVVAIVGRDMLADLPFEALPSAEGTPLGVELALEHWYSLPLGLLPAEAQEPRRRGPAVLILGPHHGPTVRERWPQLVPLPLGPKEHAALSRGLAPWPAEVVAGGAATVDAVRGALAGDPSLLHVLTHGVADPDRERSAALVMAPGSSGRELLFSDEVETWSAPPLVVLSACSSGSGPARIGDAGAAHLGGAFLRAGARAVVLAEFAVSYAPTLELARVFHAELAPAASSAEALRRARQQVSAEPGRDDPHHFALLHVVGAGHEPVYPRPAARSAWPTVLALGAGLATLAALAARRRVARQLTAAPPAR